MFDITYRSDDGPHKSTQTFILVWAKMAFYVVREYRRRYRSRRELALLSYHERDDIGAGNANAEIAKPFWRD